MGNIRRWRTEEATRANGTLVVRLDFVFGWDSSGFLEIWDRPLLEDKHRDLLGTAEFLARPVTAVFEGPIRTTPR